MDTKFLGEVTFEGVDAEEEGYTFVISPAVVCTSSHGVRITPCAGAVIVGGVYGSPERNEELPLAGPLQFTFGDVITHAETSAGPKPCLFCQLEGDRLYVSPSRSMPDIPRCVTEVSIRPLDPEEGYEQIDVKRLWGVFCEGVTSSCDVGGMMGGGERALDNLDEQVFPDGWHFRENRKRSRADADGPPQE